MSVDVMPFAGAPLVRTESIREAETVGTQLLAKHRLKSSAAGFQARINGVCLGGVSLYYMHYGARLTVFGEPLWQWVGVIVPLRGAMRVRQGGFAAVAEAEKSAVVISPDESMCLDWSADLRFFCFKIELSTLRAFVRGVDPGTEPAAPGGLAPHLVGRAGLAGLLGAASLIEFASRQHDAGGRGVPAGLVRPLRDQVMTSLLVAGRCTRRSPVPPAPALSLGAIDRARAYCEVAASPTLTPSELAAAVGVSLRSLELSFRADLGTTPQAYLLESRLRRAHAELVAGSPNHGVTVTSVAKRWGFSNVGRFAQKYFAVYGRRPSETLRYR